MSAKQLFIGIGVDRFGDGLAPLRGGRDDALEIKRMLSEHYGWEARTFNEEDKLAVQEHLRKLRDNDSGDTSDLSLIIYVATHGCIGRDGKAYLAMSGCGSQEYDRMISSSELRDWIDYAFSRFSDAQCRVLFIFDACRTIVSRGGAASHTTKDEQRVLRDLMASRGETSSRKYDEAFWFSCAESEQAEETPCGGDKQRGLFSLELTEYLAKRSPDRFSTVIADVGKSVAKKSNNRQRPSVEGQTNATFDIVLHKTSSQPMIILHRLAYCLAVLLLAALALYRLMGRGGFSWHSHTVSVRTGDVSVTGNGNTFNITAGGGGPLGQPAPDGAAPPSPDFGFLRDPQSQPGGEGDRVREHGLDCPEDGEAYCEVSGKVEEGRSLKQCWLCGRWWRPERDFDHRLARMGCKPLPSGPGTDSECPFCQLGIPAGRASERTGVTAQEQPTDTGDPARRLCHICRRPFSLTGEDDAAFLSRALFCCESCAGVVADARKHKASQAACAASPAK